MIADLPGFNLDCNPEILEEAHRAHLVVFLRDVDITRSQMDQLNSLFSINKPMIVALNKVDQFEDAEAQRIAENIVRKTGAHRADIVSIRTAGREEIIRLLRDGNEETVTRERAHSIEPLRRTLQCKLDGDLQLMEQLRDTAVLLRKHSPAGGTCVPAMQQKLLRSS